MRIIASSAEEVRLVCEACGSHRVVNKWTLGPMARCWTCATARDVLERRRRDLGHRPERRVTQPSV